MLNNQNSYNSPVFGLVMEASRGVAVSTVLTDTVNRTARAVVRWNERRKCKKLYREAKNEIAKLDDHMLRDIGWPGRYEEQNPCMRDDF
ncbi:DUF1127 domain-containing protein [Hoeflea sp. TYP-13]|uniref:DUF1127 domain-containing protein n=1 Tax=Hoeflea sp. TYP-13 TaxID=3230023 RepID=UPI0034C605E3